MEGGVRRPSFCPWEEEAEVSRGVNRKCNPSCLSLAGRNLICWARWPQKNFVSPAPTVAAANGLVCPAVRAPPLLVLTPPLVLPPPPPSPAWLAGPPAAVMCDKEFMWALKNGDLDEVKDYVAKGEDVNRTLEGGRKPLHYAADCGQLEILEFLLLKGADINAPDKHHITPLLSAVYEGHVSCVKLLLSKGADKTVKGPDGLTALEATDNQAIKALLQ